MAEVGGEESKFSHLSSEQRESLANQGREFVSRRRQKQLRGEKESADWTAAVQSEVEKRLGELNESHEREIEDVRAKGEEEKSRELSLLSEELTKQYKYHVEQLEARLQLSNESSGSDEVAVGGEFAAYKGRVEQQASEQVQQYYQQYRAEVEELQAEVDRISEERDVALESEIQLISRVEGLETRSAAAGRSGDWERERVSLLQRLQEADTKVSGLERMLVEKGREMATLVEEREENREILASREKEKLGLSQHFTHQVEQLEQEREALREKARGLETEVRSNHAEISEMKELLARKESEKRQLTEQFQRNLTASNQLSASEREKQELVAQLVSSKGIRERLESDLSRVSAELGVIRPELSGVKRDSAELQEQKAALLQENSLLQGRAGQLESQLIALRSEKSAVEQQVSAMTSQLQSVRERSESEASGMNQRLREVELGRSEADSAIISLRGEVEARCEEADRIRTELDLRVREMENLREDMRGIETEREQSRTDLTRAQERILFLQTELEREVGESEPDLSDIAPSMHTLTEEKMKILKEITALQTYRRAIDEEKTYLQSFEKQKDGLIDRVKALKEAEERDYQKINNMWILAMRS